MKSLKSILTLHSCRALALLAFLCLPLASTFAPLSPLLKHARERPFYRPQSITVLRPSLILSSSSIPPIPSATNADNIPSNIPAPEPTYSLPAFYSKLPSQISSPRALSNVIGLTVIGLSTCLALYHVDTSPLRNEPWAFRLPLSLFKDYTVSLNAAPLITKSLTSLAVYILGDVISQFSTSANLHTVDRTRILRSGAAGGFGHGPLSHFWYRLSETFFNYMGWNAVRWGVLPMIGVDQLFWGPFWNNTYIVILGILSLSSPRKILSEVKQTTVPLVVSGLKLWPLAHLVTYGLCPVDWRLVWVDAVEILWVTILATTAARTKMKAEKEEGE
ncbi:hypothetical protein TrVE_jg1738 [Triparma verrucosa]|uniref:Uncharacterized protein n=1 Tax=Triparma verrucosa TaxID=1606542 RepID=A0A9W7EM57_9STRA|nr:hypothetical protein TrVE_jg1738 [Triparma verrucosa]